MSVAKEINYSKMLAIKPAFFPNTGSGIAIFDEETHELEACSFLLASEPAELATKLRLFWDSHKGSSHEPTTLCIKYAHHYPAPYSSGHRKIIFDSLCILIEKNFKAKSLLRTTQKLNEGQFYLSACHQNMKKILTAKIKNQQPQFARLIMETIALGNFALENKASISSLPSLADDLSGTRVFQKSIAEPFDEAKTKFFPAKMIFSREEPLNICI